VAKVLSIQALHDQRWSQRRIASELGVSREAVGSYLRAHSKPAKAPTGSRRLCTEFHELILAKLEQELSAQRILQDLIDDYGFAGK
jgi:predicted transcriptional regulator